MKIFYLSFGIFMAIVAIIATNARYVTNVCEEAIATLESMGGVDDPQAPAQLSSLIAHWNDTKDQLSLSISYQTIDKMEEFALSLESYLTAGATVEFEQAKALLINELEDARQRERLSFSNLL